MDSMLTFLMVIAACIAAYVFVGELTHSGLAALIAAIVAGLIAGALRRL